MLHQYHTMAADRLKRGECKKWQDI